MRLIMRDNTEVVRILRRLGSSKEQPPSPECGICWLLSVTLDRPDLSELFQEFVKTWRWYSGNPTFPIRGTHGEPPDVTFLRKENLWDDSIYGRRRRRLCRDFADYLEAAKCT